MIVKRLSFLPTVSALLCLVICCIAVGCGGRSDGPTRYRLSGTVKYKDAAVPAGEVVVEPDPAKGNSGPQARIPIKAGVFSSSTEFGAISGPVLIQVLGTDGKAVLGPNGQPGPLSGTGSRIFPTFEMKVVLPAKDSSLAIVVPSDGPKGSLVGP